MRKLALSDALASLSLLAAFADEKKRGARLAELLSGRRETRLAETLVRWAMRRMQLSRNNVHAAVMQGLPDA